MSRENNLLWEWFGDEIEQEMNEGRKKAREKGREEGREKGRKEGREEIKREIAISMLKSCIDNEKIVKYTKLPIDVIKSLPLE